jgi:membrane-associated protease RseP (regulator of RpoE activity)
LANYFGVTQGKGVLVEEVTAGSTAEKAGLKAGDCIVRVGTEKVESVSDLHRALGRNADSDQKREVALTIVRNRHEQAISVEVESTHHVMPMHRRIASDEFIGIDPNELSRMKADVEAGQIAMQKAGKEWQSQRHNLTEENKRALDEFRREIEKNSLERSAWGVD